MEAETRNRFWPASQSGLSVWSCGCEGRCIRPPVRPDSLNRTRISKTAVARWSFVINSRTEDFLDWIISGSYECLMIKIDWAFEILNMITAETGFYWFNNFFIDHEIDSIQQEIQLLIIPFDVWRLLIAVDITHYLPKQDMREEKWGCFSEQYCSGRGREMLFLCLHLFDRGSWLRRSVRTLEMGCNKVCLGQLYCAPNSKYFRSRVGRIERPAGLGLCRRQRTANLTWLCNRKWVISREPAYSGSSLVASLGLLDWWECLEISSWLANHHET